MAKKDESYFSVVGYRKGTVYVIKENVTFDEAFKTVELRGHQFENINIAEEKRVESVPKNLLVVANAECMLRETQELLDRPVKLKETFLFLGNYTSGGPDFYYFMSYLVELTKKRKCLFVKGINEYNILEAVSGTRKFLGDKKEARKMIRSIEKELTFKLTSLPIRFPEIYALIADAHDYYENDSHIFVSGGLDLSIPYWKNTSKEKLFQTDEAFLLDTNETEKVIVFGNIPVTHLRTTETLRPWSNSEMNKIAINGDVRAGGKLYGLTIIDGERSFIAIRSKDSRAIKEAQMEKELAIYKRNKQASE